MSQNPHYAVEMRGITKRFGDVLANDQINLAIPDESIHAIVGENGAGKSTIMNILYGFYTADEGEILIDGEKTHNRRTGRRHKTRAWHGSSAFHACGNRSP